ncbi:MAG: hypothetical protein OHK0022_59940 [Roseiflexaceae bacterium]
MRLEAWSKNRRGAEGAEIPDMIHEEHEGHEWIRDFNGLNGLGTDSAEFGLIHIIIPNAFSFPFNLFRIRSIR